MNLYEKLEEAEKVAKANAEAKAEAEEKEKAQLKVKHDELMSRIEPAAEALKRFIEGSEGQAVIKLLRRIGHTITLGDYDPKPTGWARFLNRGDRFHYSLSGEGLLAKRWYYESTPAGGGPYKTILWNRSARWDDYVNLCKSYALTAGCDYRYWERDSPNWKDPFCVIEEIKAEASKLADSLLGSNTK